MVVILIVPAPTASSGHGVARYGGVVDPSKSPGNRSTSTTSISFVSSDNSSYCFSQVDPDNLIATTKEGKIDIFYTIYEYDYFNIIDIIFTRHYTTYSYCNINLYNIL